MTRRIMLASMAVFLLAGCGGVKPNPFTDKVRPLAEALQRAVSQKNKAQIDATVAKANQYTSQKHMSAAELKIFTTVQEYVQGDDPNWDKAQKLIDESLRLKL